MLGKGLVNFIQNNKLEEIEIQTEWVDCLVFSVFLDKEHLKEIEYSWNFSEDDTVRYIEWDSDEENLDAIEDKYITFEEALKLRGLAE